MTMRSLSARIGDPRPFAMKLAYCRAQGLQTLRGLSLLLGLLVLGGCGAGQQSAPGALAVASADAGAAPVRPEE